MRLLKELNLRWEALAFIAYFVTLPIYSPNLMFDYEAPGFMLVMPWYSRMALITAGASAVVVVVAALLRPGFKALDVRLLACGSVSHIAGAVLLVLAFSLALPYPGAASAIAGVLSGFGSLILSIAWGSHYSRYDIRGSIFGLALLLIVGALTNSIFPLLGNDLRLAVFATLLAIGAITPLVMAWRVRLSGQIDRPAEMPPPANPTKTLRSLFSVILWPFIGFLIFSLSMALRKVLVLGNVQAESIGAVLGATLLLSLCFIRSEKPLLTSIYQVFVPTVVSILLAASLLSEVIPLRAIGFWGPYVVFAIIGLLALATFGATANAREFSPTLIFGLAVGSFAIISLLGLLLRELPLIAERPETVLQVLSIPYFMLLVLAPGLRAWRTMFAPNMDMPARTLHENLENRCKALSAAGGLSPRESEITLYIGRGYSPAYIAKKLFLSDSTVRSHVKSIYRKLNVHSRQDLIQLIDDEE